MTRTNLSYTFGEGEGINHPVIDETLPQNKDLFFKN